MKYFAALSACALLALACRKAVNNSDSPNLSGSYTEATPTAGAMTLNFVGSNNVIVSGNRSSLAQFFWDSIPSPDTLQYIADSAFISFIVANGGHSDTLTCAFDRLAGNGIGLSLPECPDGQPCYMLAPNQVTFQK